MIEFQNPNRIFTQVCSIVRWPEDVYRHRPGTYMLVATRAVLDYVKLTQMDWAGLIHPTAVVDDFGNLVGVPQ